MVDYFILMASFFMAVLIALFSPMKGVWLLVPRNLQKPLPKEGGGPVLFRYTAFSKIQDSTTYKAQILLAMLFFVLSVLLLKLIFNPWEDWTFLLWFLSITTLILSFLMGGQINTLAALVMTVVPAGVVYWLGGGPILIGLGAGSLLGLFAGMIIARNYRRLVHVTDMELEKGETLEKRPLGRWGKTYRRFYRIVLKAIPWIVLYQVVSFWWTAIDLEDLSTGFVASFWVGQYSLLFISLLLGLNIFWLTLPLFKSMLINTNLDSAADFTHTVREWEKVPELEKDEKWVNDHVNYVFEEHPTVTLNRFLGKDGQWLCFHKEQVTYILYVVLILMAHMLGQMVQKALRLGLVPPKSIYIGGDLTGVAQALLGILFCTNVMFLICMIAALPSEKGEGEGEGKVEVDADLQNSQILWEAIRDPRLAMTCIYPVDEKEKKPDKSSPLLEIYEEKSQRGLCG